MNIPITFPLWLSAFLPIFILLILMVRYRWGAAQAAPVAAFAAAISAVVMYQASANIISGQIAKGIWNGMTIFFIILPAIFSGEVSAEAGGFKAFNKGMRKFTPDELIQLLAIGWVFVSFLQGAAGFGVPIAVTAPLLVSMGVRPVWAVVIPLIGQGWATNFGTLSIAWTALVFQSGVAGQALIDTTFWAAMLTWFVEITAGVVICYFYDGFRAIRHAFVALVVVSLCQGAGQWIFAQYNTTMCNLLANAVALVAIYALGKSPLYNKAYTNKESQIMDRQREEQQESRTGEKEMPLMYAFLPYIVLLVAAITIVTIKPVAQSLSFLKVGLPFPELTTGLGFVNKAVALYSPVTVFTHPGTFVMISAVVAMIVYQSTGYLKPGSFNKIVKTTVGKTMPAGIAIFALLAMSKIMDGTGQTDMLAYGIAQVTGSTYMVLSPLIGALGNFMTSSTTSSNILFSGLQKTMSELLGLKLPVILAAQTAGATAGSVLAPGSIMLGATTAGALGEEGQIMRKVLPYSVIVPILLGFIVAAVHLFG